MARNTNIYDLLTTFLSKDLYEVGSSKAQYFIDRFTATTTPSTVWEVKYGYFKPTIPNPEIEGNYWYVPNGLYEFIEPAGVVELPYTKWNLAPLHEVIPINTVTTATITYKEVVYTKEEFYTLYGNYLIETDLKDKTGTDAKSFEVTNEEFIPIPPINAKCAWFITNGEWYFPFIYENMDYYHRTIGNCRGWYFYDITVTPTESISVSYGTRSVYPYSLYDGVENEEPTLAAVKINNIDYFMFKPGNLYRLFEILGIKEKQNLFTEDPEEPDYTQPGEETTAGQPKNTVYNTGGLGNFTSEKVIYPSNVFSGMGGGVATYELTADQINAVLKKVWEPSFIEVLTGYSLSPVINALLWPLNVHKGDTVSGIHTETPTAGVYIGITPVSFNNLTNKTAYYINELYSKIVNFGRLQLKQKDYYNSFLDFEPYTTIQVYLPYYGFVPINTYDVFDRTLDLACILDLSTGTGKYVIMVDGVTKYSYDAQIGIQIPLTNSNISEFYNTIVRNGVSQITQIGQGKVDYSSGFGNLGGISSVKASTVGASGSNTERWTAQKPFLIIERTEPAVPLEYNKNFGRPSYITVEPSKLKGYTTIPNPIITTSATYTEKQQIIEILQAGVIIK